MKNFKFLEKKQERNWDAYEKIILNAVRYGNGTGSIMTHVNGWIYQFHDNSDKVLRINHMYYTNGIYYIDYQITIYNTHTSNYRLRIDYNTLGEILRQDEDL